MPARHIDLYFDLKIKNQVNKKRWCDMPVLSNPTLPPLAFVLQRTPLDDLGGLGKDSFDFNPLNRVGGQVRLDHQTDQKVFLLGDGRHRCPLGQQQFFGVQGVHGCAECVSE